MNISAAKRTEYHFSTLTRYAARRRSAERQAFQPIRDLKSTVPILKILRLVMHTLTIWTQAKHYVQVIDVGPQVSSMTILAALGRRHFSSTTPAPDRASSYAASTALFQLVAPTF